MEHENERAWTTLKPATRKSSGWSRMIRRESLIEGDVNRRRRRPDWARRRSIRAVGGLSVQRRSIDAAAVLSERPSSE